MSYQISSTQFDDSGISELLKTLTIYFRDRRVPFFVVGAAARDIVLGQIYNRKSRRRTNDLDIAIMIRDWDAFENVVVGLENIPGFTRSTRQKQRFHYGQGMILDVIPFGEIAKYDRNIYWPPDETTVMSVSGFSEMAMAALSVTVDGEYSFKVASLPGLFILKLAAWRERSKSTNKDAEDIAYILEEYYEVNLERCIKEHSDIYNNDDFNTLVAGAILMGRDIKTLLMPNVGMIDRFSQIIFEEIRKEEGSLLINQILETHRHLKFEEVNVALAAIVNEMSQ